MQEKNNVCAKSNILVKAWNIFKNSFKRKSETAVAVGRGFDVAIANFQRGDRPRKILLKWNPLFFLILLCRSFQCIPLSCGVVSRDAFKVKTDVQPFPFCSDAVNIL